VVLAYPYQYNAWAEAGVNYLELTDYLESPVYGLSADQIADYYPVFSQRDVYAGERLGVPGLFYGQTLLYNRTWAQELGFADPPLSDQQFLLQACAASGSNADGTGGWMINSQPGSAAAWLLAFSGDLEDEGEVYQFGIPEIASAFEFLTELRAAECAWQPSSLYAFEDFAGRKGLFYSVSTREVGAIEAAFDAVNNRDTWDLIGLPNHLGETRISVYGRSYLIIESDLPQQIGAWMLVSHLTNIDSQMWLAETAGYYPLSSAAGELLRDHGEMPPAWLAGLDLLDRAVNEPRDPSWRVMRGVVQDAAAEVLHPGFAPGTLSLVLDQLQELADDLHAGDQNTEQN
jgi:ABC-type glycerol-3-phosphate transport system substrate-binding protein